MHETASNYSSITEVLACHMQGCVIACHQACVLACRRALLPNLIIYMQFYVRIVLNIRIRISIILNE